MENDLHFAGLIISFTYFKSRFHVILNFLMFSHICCHQAKIVSIGQSDNFLSIQIKSTIILTLLKFNDWIENHQKYDGVKRVTLENSSKNSLNFIQSLNLLFRLGYLLCSMKCGRSGLRL